MLRIKGRFIVTGGAGFIGSHLVDALLNEGCEVLVVDNLTSGYREQVDLRAEFEQMDIAAPAQFARLVHDRKPDGIFHCAALARTPWCIEDPLLTLHNNVTGTVSVLDAARRAEIKRVVLSSSNVVYAAETPYKASKLSGERWAKAYVDSYGMSVVSLRYSNVYGPRQSEEGPSPNVFAALRKSAREKGFVEITGDGEQTRDFTHVYDIVRGQMLAMCAAYCGALDLCTGKNYSLNDVAKFFKVPVHYLPERPGDIKHIIQNPEPAFRLLGWSATIPLPLGIKDCMPQPKPVEPICER